MTWFQAFERKVLQITRTLHIVGVFILVVIMFLVVADVAFRYLLNHPIPGALELTEMFMAALVMLGLAYTATVRGHIGVEIVMSRLPQRIQAIADAFGSFLGFAIFLLISWQGTVDALRTKQVGEITDVLHIPLYPAKFLVPVGAFVLCIVFLIQGVNSIREAKG